MPTWSPADALMTMTSPLGPDVLIPIALTAQEAISQPFQFEVSAVCQSGVIDPNRLLNNPACVTLQNEGTPVRYFHGIVQSVSAEGTIRGDTAADLFQVYRLRLVPRLWFLSQTTDCRVREQMPAEDIIRSMFSDANLTDYRFVASGETQTRQYTIQYNETDLHFATRLMEEEGWYYFFQHSHSTHTLVIADHNSSFPSSSGTLYIVGGRPPAMPLLDFNSAATTVRGKMTLQDYEPITPTSLLRSPQPTVLQTSGASTRDDFRWPANASYTYALGEQQRIVRNRALWEMQAAEAVATLYDGACTFGGLVAGGQFTISSQPASTYDETYVVRSITHTISDETWLNQSSTASYSNRFVAFLSSTIWRQPIVTPRPRMNGVYTALVMGPVAEDIYTDDMARVKVRFHWDWRESSTVGGAVWARVIQPWAGKGWGAQFLPRVGTEVAVAFVDGDPDRPIVIGGLYNGAQAPIYLTADKNKSGLRTRSTTQGNTENFSELTFDDTKGSELIFMHAEKDLFTEIENDQTLTVGQNRDVTVSKGNDSLTVSTGNYSISIDKGQMSVNAMDGIKLTCGSNSIEISPSGITISGPQISLSAEASGSFDGGAQLELTGGLVSINA